MANYYPALKLNMGDKTYYSVSMTIEDVAMRIRFAEEVHEAKTLNEFIQRDILPAGAKSIAEYLQKPHRFFNSLVVATTGGNPKFEEVSMEQQPKLELLKEQMQGDFGVLSFDGDQKYYALDGQHRLQALKGLIYADQKGWPECPPGLEKEKINVLFLVKNEEISKDEWLKFYRRTFSALNRYAKPTSNFDNIVMDEDDIFAILTRRLITEHIHFSWDGKPKNNPKVAKKKVLKDGDTQFISLENLYTFNQKVLWDSQFQEDVAHGEVRTKYITKRPDDEVLDESYRTLCNIWDALLETIKLDHPPQNMRHQEEGVENMDYHALYLALGMVDILPELVTDLLFTNGKSRQKALLKKDLEPLSKIDWSLWKVPFRHIAINQNMPDKPNPAAFTIGPMSASDAGKFLLSIFRWILGIVAYDKEGLATLEMEYKANLGGGGSNLSDKKKDELWQEVLKLKKKISN
jgi:DNA sulfur modification protein DndB